MRKATIEGDAALPELRCVREAIERRARAVAVYRSIADAHRGAVDGLRVADDEVEKAWNALREVVDSDAIR